MLLAIDRRKTAIIIGAGPAGLTAAYKLLQDTDIKPIILEASSYIGGISRTAEHHGNRMDLGGHRFFSKNHEVNALWEELLPLQGAPACDDKELGRSDLPLSSHGPDPEVEDEVMLVRNRVSRIFFLGKFFDYPVSLKMKTLANMGFSRTMKAGFGYMHSAFRKLPEDSLENFYINRFGKPLYSMFFEGYTEKVWGRHPSSISADWGAQRVKGLSLRKTLVNALFKPFRKNKVTETSLIEQFHYPKKGPGQLWETLADEIRSRGGEIHLNMSVDKIHSEQNHVVAVEAAEIDPNSLNTGSGERTAHTFTGDYFLSTMPIKDLIDSMAVTVPPQVKEVATALPYRDFMTVGLLVKHLDLVNDTSMKTLFGGIPDCWIYIQEHDVRLGRLQIFNNWSPYMVKDPCNTVWIGLEYFCNENDDYWRMSEEKFIQYAIDELVKIGLIQADSVLDAVRLRVKKAYPAYFGSYEHFDQVRDWLDKFDNLYCIGRNGQHRYNNMDHSMLTAMEAVRAIRGMTDKSAVWQVNTEQEYHEANT